MKCAKDYQAVVSADGRLAFVIPAGKDEPHSPKLIYNGGESALLYRSAGRHSGFGQTARGSAKGALPETVGCDHRSRLCRRQNRIRLRSCGLPHIRTVFPSFLPKNFQGVKGLEFFFVPVIQKLSANNYSDH